VAGNCPPQFFIFHSHLVTMLRVVANRVYTYPMPLPITQSPIAPGFIDLGLGDPAFSLLPLELLRDSAAECFARGDNSFLQYGAEQGNGPFREALAEFLSRGYGLPVGPESLFATHGASGALDLTCTLFTRRGDTIFVEEPSYFLALRIFRDHDLHIVPIPTDAEGLIVESVEERVSAARPKFIYTIPTFQNPSGQTLSAERRAHLVALAREHNFLIVADEVYHFLDYTRKPPAPFATYAADGNVIAVNSFSKILAPGLRLGWIQADAETIKRFFTCGLLDSGGGLNPFASAVVREPLEKGAVEKNIEKLKTVYRSRAQRMELALKKYIPAAQFETPEGGFFFWVRLPGMDTFMLQKKAEAFRVGFRPGIRFSSADGLKDFIRLSFVHFEEDEIEEGIIRLRNCVEAA
jgi:2-aminoadipate transaminase